MGKLCAVISCLLLSVGAVTAQGAQTQNSERLLPQWLTGILAVTGFLFLTFVGFLVKKAWCEEPSRKKTTMELVGVNEFVNKNTSENSLDMARKKTTMESVEEDEYVNENNYDTSLEMRRDNMNVNDSVIDVTVDKATVM
ncbi:PDZK1-interacting protein 1 [Pseudoliparis swirei]|uniref:PDZK1-interacting protein 1 n=1 Tax=Pseudoliparis swirei TaxID=2059687 RepID=UPI0024BED2AC|nr:PDZK1-interacting protein 1 [Pseudoliparis swirei]